MPIETAEDLIEALRASGLFAPEPFAAIVRELAPIEGLAPALKQLVDRDHLTVYQLRKVLHGKSADLFLGPFLITDKLGEGGMGRVYRARDSRLRREVALKVVRPSLLSNPVVRARYRREVEAARSLGHPNIVRVEDAGEVGGKVYLAMEFVDGVDLARLVEEHRPLEVAEACEYARQVALGLSHAHAAGFVHRDVKPSNVVVAGERHVPQATEPAVVKLLDMGLIRGAGLDDGGTDLTRAGTVVGTADYMSPEQARDPRAVDHRADLYSLGCTLYFLLAGQPPFPTGTTIEKIISHQIDPPTPVQALRPEVPATVAALVSGLMAKRAADRIQSAEEAAVRLAPLARYPHGAQPVPIRVRHSQPAPPMDSMPTAVIGLADTDRTPGGKSAEPPDLTEPPSSPMNMAIAEPEVPPPAPVERRSRAWVWVVVALAVVGAALVCLIAPGK